MSEQSTAPMTGDAYLVKMKLLRKSDAFVAMKMGIDPEDVARRWKAIQDVAAEDDSGTKEIGDASQVLEQQFAMVGQTLSMVLTGLRNPLGPTELRSLIESCPKGADLATYLLKNAVILRPFSLPSPEEMMERFSGQRPG